LIGYGHLGQYISNAILTDPKISSQLELVFVWNRTLEKFQNSSLPPHLILPDLSDFPSRQADLIIEVAHPCITQQFGTQILENANYLIGSPTALADSQLEAQMQSVANSNINHGIYIPRGALWGAQDIHSLALSKGLKALTITMKKHPNSLKLEPPLSEKLEQVPVEGEYLLFEGSVRQLCPLAPNNVNTMAVAALAASSLGFDGVQARLVADRSLDSHVILIEAIGVGDPPLRIMTERINPAKPGAVTGNATYGSFLSSILSAAKGSGNGFHFC